MYVIIKVCCEQNVNLVKILLSNRIRALALCSVLIVICKWTACMWHLFLSLWQWEFTECIHKPFSLCTHGLVCVVWVSYLAHHQIIVVPVACVTARVTKLNRSCHQRYSVCWGPILQTRVVTLFSSVCCPATHQHWFCCRCYWPCTVLTMSTPSSGWCYPTDVGSRIWSPSTGQTPSGDMPLWCEWGGWCSELMGSNGRSNWIKLQISSTYTVWHICVLNSRRFKCIEQSEDFPPPPLFTFPPPPSPPLL